tara:strand:- start:8454 stop:9434 length:981 start_codon:yes stop_codon:yes gene_type:complete
MPYPNEHTARQTDPAQYDEFRRFVPENAPEGLDVILGIKEGKSEIQSVRADADKITPPAFRQWLEEHRFDADQLEEATRKSFDSFARWMPLSLKKSDDDEEMSKAVIGGICSTSDMDFEGETIEQAGIDWSYFLQHGWFNHEHQQGTANVLGHPTKIEPVGDEKTRVEGVLYLDKQLGRDVYETAAAMQKAGGDRSLGFSVEGQVLMRDPAQPKRVLKARVLNVAITAAPVNPHTNLELIARSMGAIVGYQTPTIPDADATLSALVQQDLNNRVSVGTYGAPEKTAPKISRAQIRALITSRMRDEEGADLDRLIDGLLEIAGQRAK